MGFPVLGERLPQRGLEGSGLDVEELAGGLVGDDRLGAESLDQSARDVRVDRGHESDPERGQPRRYERHRDLTTLILFPQDVLALGIGTAVADKFVAPRFETLADLGAGFQHGGVDIVRPGQRKFVEQIEVIPQPDTVAVIAPGVVALALRRRCSSRVAAEPGAKREILDIVVEDDSEPFALRPVIDRPLRDRHVVVTIMRGKLHRCIRH